MSERERNRGADDGAVHDPGAAGNSWAEESLPADAVDDKASEVRAPSPARSRESHSPLRRSFSPPRSPWLHGALSASLVIMAAVAIYAMGAYGLVARLGLDAPLDLAAPALAGVVALIMAWIAWRAAAGLALRHAREVRRQRDVLARIAALDLDSEHGWEDAALRQEAAVERFLADVRVRHRRQRADLERAAVLRSEVARLGASLMAGDRGSVGEAYETPAVGRVASGAALLYEEIDQLRRDRADMDARLSETGAQLGAATGEARRWQAVALAQVDELHAAVQQMAAEVQRFGEALAEKIQGLEEIERRGVPTIGDVLRELPALATGERAGALTQTAHNIKDLVARGGSLAIQTALEVSRLGERGETLFPLTESLKSLITEFQGIATRLEQLARGQESAGPVFAKVQAQLGEIESVAGRDIPELEAWRRSATRLSQFKLSLVKIGTELSGLRHDFVEQRGRLEGVAGSLSVLTGVPCEHVDEAAATSAPTGFEVESFGAPVPEAASVDASPQPSAPAPERPTDSPLFAPEAEVAPSPEPEAASFDTLFASAGPNEELSDEPSLETSAPVEAPEVADLTAAVAAVTLPDDEERIYDLSEFGAVAVDEPTPAADRDDEDRVYELSEFGAVAIA